MGNTASGDRLCPQGMMDLVEGTQFTEEEIRLWYKEFRKDFPLGRLSIDQFKDVYIQHFPNGDATKFAEHVFRTFDKDGDHSLDFREFMIGLSVTARGGPKDRLRWAFEMYDIDESGYISREECTELVKAIYTLQPGAVRVIEYAEDITANERVDQLFAKKDQDNDGFLTEQEYMDGMGEDHYLMRILQSDQFRY